MRIKGFDVAFGLSWDHQDRGRWGAAILAAFLLMATVLVATPAAALPADPIRVVVGGSDPGAMATAVDDLGGVVAADLAALDVLVADVPASALAALERRPEVDWLAPDRPVAAQSTVPGEGPATMAHVVDITGAGAFHAAGFDGRGVGVALIDSGVVPVDGLDAPGKLIGGPDLSFEGSIPALQSLDTFGHGTHLAGVIAASGPGLSGMAPGAHLVNLKVADARGIVDVTQILAAIDWVVQHKDDPGLDIGVLALAFGTESSQSYRKDPLAYAVSVAWDHGITVVVAAGNDGASQDQLRNPASNPFVIAVGAADTQGTPDRSDDVMTEFSACGTGKRFVDLVAPGTSIASLRVPGSSIDQAHPEARFGDTLFLGSGTSQASAIVAGAAALVLEAHPDATPDEVKALLTGTAVPVPGRKDRCDGAGMIDLAAALGAPLPVGAEQDFKAPTGKGSIESARGDSHVLDEDGKKLKGNKDIHGEKFKSKDWAEKSRKGKAWDGDTWNGNPWNPGITDWSPFTWSGSSWSGSSWSGSSWSGSSWSGSSWSGSSWSGSSWSGSSWSSDTWAGASWS